MFMELISRITALLLLVVLSPCFFLISVISLVIQGRPILFIQTRVGKGFKHFNIFKFRTIKKTNTDFNLFKTGKLPEATKWGLFLRKTKLDELPQLINIIKGDMRFIGPRPEIPEYVKFDLFSFLEVLKPGLSGYSSILFRNESEILSLIDAENPYDDILRIKVSLDKYYLKRKSFFEDFKLVTITIFSLFIPKTMGHYFLMKMLKIEGDTELNLRNILGSVKIRKTKIKRYEGSKNSNLLLLFLADILIIFSSLILAILIKNDLSTPSYLFNEKFFILLMFFIFSKLSFFYFFDLYKGMWRYASVVDLLNITKANLTGSLFIMAYTWYFNMVIGLSTSILIIDFMITFFMISFIRLSIRVFYSQLITPEPYKIKLDKKVLLIGAGTTGEFICKELLSDPNHGMSPIGFLDDRKTLHNKNIHGKKVFGEISMLDELIIKFDEILICFSDLNQEELKRIIKICKNTTYPYRILPSSDKILSGKININNEENSLILKLLGKSEVNIDSKSIKKYLHGKRILITGAGGSIGSELVRQSLKYDPALLVMLDNSELNLFQIERAVIGKESNVLIKPLLSNIRDNDVMKKVFNEYEPQIVFHAAAYKHVEMQEKFPWEAVKTNVQGTENLTRLSIEHNVEKFILISTDKAVNPVNVMGATKRLAEIICQGANSSSDTQFMAVRFGNVLGSSGSVIPIFEEQIKAGGPVTITDPEMKRHFMSIPEASQLIFQAGGIGRGGEIFSLDMGKPIKIIDIAHELIKLSGFEPGIDIPISYIGAKNSEKILEELSYDSESINQTIHDKILEIRNIKTSYDLNKISNKVMNGDLFGLEFDRNSLINRLSSLVPEYEPNHNQKITPIVLNDKPKIEA